MSESGVVAVQPQAFDRAVARDSALGATAILIGIAAVKLLVHFAAIHRYGFFRDELYYMACGEHLAWGYVDQPPLIAFAAWFARHVFGSSMAGLRLLPILCGATIVFLTGWFAGELGGGSFAQGLAAVGIAFAPAYLAFDSFFSMNAFEPLFWLLCAWIVVRVVKGSSPKLWLLFGLVAGIGLENKHTMLVIGFALAAALALSGQARLFRTKWIWVGAAVALAIFLPNLIWEARHGWPQVEVVRNAQLFKNTHISALRFLGDQVLFLGPFTLPLWLSGIWYVFAQQGGRLRFLGWSYAIVLAVFAGFDGKSYYALPIYPILIAAGAVAFEEFTNSLRNRSYRVAYLSALVFAGIGTMPFGVPILPVAAFVKYSHALPYASLVKTERDAAVPLPQLYADMFGWDALAATVGDVYRTLPKADRGSCAIIAGNYGEAGAIDYYGPALGLPKAISGHNSYYDWGPRGYSGNCAIIFGEQSGKFIKNFGEVQRVAVVPNPHGMPSEKDVAVYVCHKPIAPLAELWPRFKMII